MLAPVKGRAVPLEQVPDPVFAQLMTGPGAAVDPPRAVLDAVAPVSGKGSSQPLLGAPFQQIGFSQSASLPGATSSESSARSAGRE